MRLPATLLLLFLSLLGCAHGAPDAGPTLAQLRHEAPLPDGRWLVEGEGSAGMLRVAAGAARLELADETRLSLQSWRAGELWGLTGEYQGRPIELRALLADDGAGWLWQIGGAFRGALRPVLPVGELAGPWEVAPLAGGALPESLELRGAEVRLPGADGEEERVPCLLVEAGRGERILLPSPPAEQFAALHLLRFEEGWIVWREGEPLALGYLHRPGARPAWVDPAAGAGQSRSEARRFALATRGMVGELRLEAGKAHMDWEGLLGEKKLDLAVVGAAGPALRLEDRKEPKSFARLLTVGARGWFWIEGEPLVLPAFEVIAPSPRLLGRWSSAPARLGEGGRGVSGLEIEGERVAMLQERGEPFEYRALATRSPGAPVFFLRGPGAGLTVVLHPAGSVVAVAPPSNDSSLAVLYRGRAPGWLPLAGLEPALEAFCRAAKAAPPSGSYRERLERMLGRLEAERRESDGLTDLLARLEVVPREARYPLLVRELAGLGVEDWKCKAAAGWLGAADP